MIDFTVRDFKVYGIFYNGNMIYVGQTANYPQRLKSHNAELLKIKNGKKATKELYSYLADNNIFSLEGDNIKMEIIREFDNRLDGERYEAYLILCDYWSNNPQLKQKVPIIKDALSKKYNVGD